MKMSLVNANPHYDQIGGETGIRRLVDCFYKIMDESPQSLHIRKMHPEDLSSSREKLFMFLSEWLGGPQLYAEQFEHPKLHQWHMPFQIGQAERDAWMHCMHEAMCKTGVDENLRVQLTASFFKIADFLRNKQD